ncbi:aminotransferase class V-fold PLP-dependent enzyme [Candidatus Peribacteria bacterium]|nr:aminotransferase class V-fold PLP-dependent enzyme [Candidatus Peribacteria bacterium]
MVYLDHAAHTVVFPEVWERLDAVREPLRNPQSVHRSGRYSRALLDESRTTIARLLQARVEEILFTSGGTEALQLGLMGVMRALHQQGRAGYALYSPLLHPGARDALMTLSPLWGLVPFPIPLTPTGQWDFPTLSHADRSPLPVQLIVVDDVSSLTGSRNDPNALLPALQSLQAERPLIVLDHCAGAAEKLLRWPETPADIAVLSSEKLGAPAGTGLLLLRKGTPFSPLHTGSQEWGLRPGTPNTLGAIALATALELLAPLQHALHTRYTQYQQQLREALRGHYHFPLPLEHTAAHILTGRHPVLTAQQLTIRADIAGLELSAGPACTSGSSTVSEGLLALGMTNKEAERLWRLSMGPTTTAEDLATATQILLDCAR